MGYDVGACAAFGILIDDPDAELFQGIPEVGELVNAFGSRGPDGMPGIVRRRGTTEQQEDLEVDPSTEEEVVTDIVNDQLLPAIMEALSSKGVQVPENAELLYTGNGDDRPGRCDAPEDAWVLGFGLFMNPADYPEMHESYLKRSRWHTWVWGG